MKIYEIEDLEPGDKNQLDTKGIINQLKTDCSDSISAMKTAEDFLYRGISTDMSDAFIGRSRENRKPIDLPQHYQDTIDLSMKAVGMEALRSNSIFCSGALSQAGCYGEIYIIFPVNGFKFSWSPIVKDLAPVVSGLSGKFFELGKAYKVLSNTLADKLYNIRILENNVYRILEIFNGDAKTDADATEIKAYSAQLRYNLGWLISHDPSKAKIDVIQKALQYLISKGLINHIPELDNLEEIPILKEKLRTFNQETNYKDIGEGLEYRNTDFAKAIMSKKEIMISGSYYAFKRNYSSMLKGLIS